MDLRYGHHSTHPAPPLAAFALNKTSALRGYKPDDGPN